MVMTPELSLPLVVTKPANTRTSEAREALVF